MPTWLPGATLDVLGMFMFMDTGHVDHLTLMMFRGGVGWEWGVSVHVHVTLIMLRW